jgi:hypothetical protein
MEINNKQYFGSYNLDGLIHELSDDYLNDNGDILRCFAHFKVKFTEGNRKTRYNHIKFRLKRGIGNAAHLSPDLVWRYKIDQMSWSSWMQVDMGAIGDYTPYQEAYSLGIGVEIEFQMAVTDAVEFKIDNMILTGMTLEK